MSWVDGLLAVDAASSSTRVTHGIEQRTRDPWVLGIAGLGLLQEVGCPLLQAVVLVARVMDIGAKSL
eukprot:1478731-Alexandrium_andersonii.AAC.1